MAELAVMRHRHHPLLGLLLGAAGGGLAAVLSHSLSPWWALASLAALAGGSVMLVAPRFAVYTLTAMTIVQWPGDLIKYVGAVVVASIGLWALVTRRRLVPQDHLLAILFLLGAMVIAGALALGEPEATSLAGSYVGFVGLYWVVSTLTTSPLIIRRLAAVMLLSGFLLAVIGLVQVRYQFIWPVSTLNAGYHATVLGISDPVALRELQAWEGTFRVESLAGTPDFLGLTMQILLPFAFYWTIERSSTKGRLAGLVLLVVLGATLVLSLTRGAMVTTILITIPLLAVKYGLRRALPYLMIGLMVVGVATAAWEPLRSRALSTSEEWLNGDPATAGGWRRQMIEVGLRIFADNFWLGVGPGQHRRYLPIYADSALLVVPDVSAVLPLHNAYLAMAIELGVGGLLLLLLLVGLTWRRLRRLQRIFRATGDRRLTNLAHAAEVAWIGLIVNIAMYPQLDRYRYFWLLLAFIGGLSRLAADHPLLRQQTRRLNGGHLASGTGPIDQRAPEVQP